MKSRLAKFAGVICLSVAACGQGLAQSQPPVVPNIAGLESNAMKYAIAGSAASAAVGLIVFVAHHHHGSQPGKERVSKGTPVTQGQSSPGVLKSDQLKGAGKTKSVEL